MNGTENNMTVVPRRAHLGRHLFGVATLTVGLITLVWHDCNDWPQLRYIVYATSVAQIIGGVAVQFPQMAKTGAALLVAAYLVFALLCVPAIVTTPQSYNSWGNFFEQFSLVTVAAIVAADLSSRWSRETVHRIGPHSFGRVYRIVYAGTGGISGRYRQTCASVGSAKCNVLAVATAVLFALAAVALLANRMALLATHLLTLMLVIFGVLVWVPLILSDPHNHTNWSEGAETFAIAGAVWILADH